jgi:hypothetical protein
MVSGAATRIVSRGGLVLIGHTDSVPFLPFKQPRQSIPTDYLTAIRFFEKCS